MLVFYVSGIKHIRAKVVVLGDAAVGKTTLIRTYLGGKPLAGVSYKPTIGVDVYKKEDIYSIEPFGKIKTIWDIWDMAGAKPFREISGIFLKGAMCGIVMFDLSRDQTLISVPEWINTFIKSVGKKPIILVGNKADLCEKGVECVSHEKRREYAERVSETFGFRVPYIETSALYNINVRETFEKLVTELIKQYLSKERK